jgi:hypothetical protein
MAFFEMSESITNSSTLVDSKVDYINKTNQCGHLSSESDIHYICYECALYCCKNCFDNKYPNFDICNGCIRGTTTNSAVLSRCNTAQPCPTCKKMCINYQSSTKVSYGLLFLLKSNFYKIVGITPSSTGDGKETSHISKHHCRNCNLDFEVEQTIRIQ